ncbi:RNA methyltransferase, partial [Arthrospira platensis SPKY1]|nr:RNA methyltransferase [Arthrospira platensis SPKY1]
GSDSHANAIRIAQSNAMQAGMEEQIQWQIAPMEECPLPEAPGLVVLNPPYNERMPVDEIESLYQLIGSTLKHRFSGFQAWVLSANEKAIHAIGLRPSRKIGLYNGALPCKFLKFELYAGSKKGKKMD